MANFEASDRLNSGESPPLDDLAAHRAQDPAFSIAIELIPVPVALVRCSDWSILRTNRPLDELYQVTVGSLHGEPLHAIFPRLCDRRRLQKCLRAAGRVDGEMVRGLRSDQGELLLSVWQRYLVGSGNVECALTLLYDITRHALETHRAEQRSAAIAELLELSERERGLIAYEIHDGVIQEMNAALMHLQVAQRSANKLAPKDKQEIQEQLATIDRLLREGVSEARRLIDGVRLPDLEVAGLVGALSTLAGRVAETTGIQVDFAPEVGLRRFPPQVENALYRVVQEALTNVWRHSRSPRARIDLVERGKTLEVRVTDWGVGFEPKSIAADGRHVGLAGVRQRARLIGGSAQIESRPGQGTAIRVSVPLGENPLKSVKS